MLLTIATMDIVPDSLKTIVKVEVFGVEESEEQTHRLEEELSYNTLDAGYDTSSLLNNSFMPWATLVIPVSILLLALLFYFLFRKYS